MSYSYEQESFKSAAVRSNDEKTLRSAASVNVLKFGVPFLDKTLGGILPTDLILIGARTGAGKTELAVNIAKHVAINGKRCHMFALEAEEAEIERRMKYQVMAELYQRSGGQERINFQDWYLGKYDFLGEFEELAGRAMASYENLHTFYRDSKFDLAKFTRMFRSLDGQSDLVIIDHIHYFDFDGENENKAVADIMKAIKDMSQIQKVPVILIAHLRKIGKQERTLLPTMEDFHGTSNLSKICTRSVLMAPGGLDDFTRRPITYIQASKNRLGGERTRVVGKMEFDPVSNTYLKSFQMGTLSDDEKRFIPFSDTDKVPDWLR